MNVRIKKLLSMLLALAMVASMIVPMDFTFSVAKAETPAAQSDLPDAAQTAIALGESVKEKSAEVKSLFEGQTGEVQAICPVCYANGDTSVKTWLPVTGHHTFSDGSHYYLTGDCAYTLSGPASGTYCYNLNGKTHSTTNPIHPGKGTLNIIDTFGGAQVIGTKTNQATGAALYLDSAYSNGATGSTTVVNVFGGTYTKSGTNNASVVAIDTAGGTINMYAGAKITAEGISTSGSAYGLAVLIKGDATNQATFNMYGGEIVGGTNLTGNGGAVCVGFSSKNKAAFNLYDGKISGGQAQYGGNIYVFNGGELNVYGGAILGGKAKSTANNGYGGNICVRGTTSDGGGILRVYGGYILGGAAYSKNSENILAAAGQTVYLGDNATSTFVMTGGTIVGQVRCGKSLTGQISGSAKVLPSIVYDGVTYTSTSGLANVSFTSANLGEDGDVWINAALDASYRYCPACEAVKKWTTVSAGSTMTAGTHYRLGADITHDYGAATNAALFSGAGCLDLNGKAVTVDGGRFLTATGVFNVFDFAGGAVVSGSYNIYGDNGTTIQVNGTNAKLGLYGGTYKGHLVAAYTNTNANGVIRVRDGVLDMYDGVVVDGEGLDMKGSSLVLVQNNGTAATFNMHGGIIKNGTTTGKGGNVLVNSQSNSTFNMYGGVIANGTAANGDNVYINKTAVLAGGTIVGEVVAAAAASVTLKNDMKIVLEKDGYTNGTAGLKLNGALAEVSELTTDASITVSDEVGTVLTNATETDLTGVFAHTDSDLSIKKNADNQYYIAYPDPDEDVFNPEGCGGKAYCPICGGEAKDWTAINPEDTKVVMTGGHYYLAEDFAYNTAWNNAISGYGCLNLNGKTLSTETVSVKLIHANVADQALNVMDTSAEKSGKVIGAFNYAGQGGAAEADGGTLNLYGGTYTTTNTNVGSAVAVRSASGGAINIYDGVVINAGAAKTGVSNGPAISINADNGKSAEVTIYGGTITGAENAGNGGAIYLGGAGSKTLTIYDGQITGGKAANGNAIFCASAANMYLNLYGGTFTAADGATGNAIYLQYANYNRVVFGGKDATGENDIAPTIVGGVKIAAATSVTLKNDVKIDSLDLGGVAADISGLGAGADIKMAGTPTTLAGIILTGAGAEGLNITAVDTTNNEVVYEDSKYVLKMKPDVVVGKDFDPANHYNIAWCEKCEKYETWTPVGNDVDTIAMTGGHYYLTEEITKTFETNSTGLFSGYGCINLNGKDVTVNGGRFLTAGAGKTNVFDLVGGSEISGSYNIYGNNGATIHVDGATAELNLYGGTYKGHNYAEFDDAAKSNEVVRVRNGVLKMYDGAVIDGSNNSNRGNALVRIEKNTATTEFYMYGGVIKNGTSTGNRGGNVFLAANTGFYMYGGQILGGSAQLGGSVYVTSGATLTVAGGVIAGGESTSESGAIYVQGAAANVTFGAAETAPTIVGGMRVYGATVTMVGAPQVVTSYKLDEETTITSGEGVRLVNGALLNVDAVTAEAKIRLANLAVDTVFTTAYTGEVVMTEVFSNGPEGANLTKTDEGAFVYKVIIPDPEVGVFDPETCGGKAYCPICGGEAKTWTEIESGAGFTMDGGHYYLAENVTITSSIKGSGCINLNGKTLTGGAFRAIDAQVGDEITIMDTSSPDGKGTAGKVIGAIAYEGQGGAVNSNGGTVNIYGGTYINNADGSPVGIRYEYTGTINMYGGVIDGRIYDAEGNVTDTAKSRYGAAVVINTNQAGKPGIFRMHGGRIIGGNSTGNGDAIYLRALGVNVLEITGGTVEGGDVYAAGTGTVTVGSATVGTVTVQETTTVVLKDAAKITTLTLNGAVANADDLTTDAAIGIAGLARDDVFATDATPTEDLSAKFTILDNNDLMVNNANGTYSAVKVPDEPTMDKFDPDNCGGRAYCPICEDFVSWTKVTGNTALADGDHYYLAGALSSKWVKGPASGTACFNLNGKALTAQNPIYAGAGVLNIIDTEGGAVVTGQRVNQSKGAAIFFDNATNATNNATSVINLYGGTYKKSADNNSSIVMIDSNGGTLNIYEGAVIDASERACGAEDGAYGLAVSIWGGTCNLRGGKILGGNNSLKWGGAVYVNGTFNLRSGSVTGGTASNGGNFYVTAAGTLNVEGGFIGGGTSANGANIWLAANTSKLSLTGGTIVGGVRASAATTITASGAPKVLRSATYESVEYTAAEGMRNCNFAASLPNLTKGTEIWMNTDFSVCYTWCDHCNEGAGQVTKWNMVTAPTEMTGEHYRLVENINHDYADDSDHSFLTGHGYLDLNGKTVNINAGRFLAAGAGTTVIVDTVGGAVVTGSANRYVNNGATIKVDNATAQVYLQGGTFKGSEDTLEEGVTDNDTDNCVIRVRNGKLYMYNNVVIDGSGYSTGTDAVVRVARATDATAEFTMNGGKIINGDNLNVYVNTNDTFTMNGGLIAGGQIAISSFGNTVLTGGTVVGELGYNAGTMALKNDIQIVLEAEGFVAYQGVKVKKASGLLINVAELTADAKVVFTALEAGAVTAESANAEALVNAGVFTVTNAYFAKAEGDQVVLALAAVSIGDKAYENISDAMEDYKDGDMIVLNANITLNGEEFVLDVANSKSNLVISGWGTVYGVDSSNDDYEGYKTITVKDNVKVADEASIAGEENGKATTFRYIALSEGNGVYGFHRFKITLSNITLRTANDSVYFKVKYELDEKLLEAMEAHGVVLSVKEMPGADFTTDMADQYTRVTVKDGYNAETHTLQTNSCELTGILKAIGTDDRTGEENREYLDWYIYANVYIKVNGKYHLADTTTGDTKAENTFKGVAITFAQLVNQVDNSNAGNDLLTAFYQKWVNQFDDDGARWAVVMPKTAAIVAALPASKDDEI